MKRAEVWREGREEWFTEIHESKGAAAQDLPIASRITTGRLSIEPFPTHAAALAHALAEVGLSEKNGAPR